MPEWYSLLLLNRMVGSRSMLLGCHVMAMMTMMTVMGMVFVVAMVTVMSMMPGCIAVYTGYCSQ